MIRWYFLNYVLETPSNFNYLLVSMEMTKIQISKLPNQQKEPSYWQVDMYAKFCKEFVKKNKFFQNKSHHQFSPVKIKDIKMPNFKF